MTTHETLVAEIQVDEVRPDRRGFTLRGSGPGGRTYRLEMTLDYPTDARTRRVLGELLSQSEWRVYRQVGKSLGAKARRARSRVPEP